MGVEAKRTLANLDDVAKPEEKEKKPDQPKSVPRPAAAADTKAAAAE